MTKIKIYISQQMISAATPSEYNKFMDDLKPRKVTVDGTFKDQFIFTK